MADNADLLVPIFRIHTMRNEAKSKLAGRPIFDEMEVCEIRMAANKQTVGVFPAHEVWRTAMTADEIPEDITYAMRFPEQYKKFKAGEAQAMSGTPLEELSFVTAGKRLELKALNIYTAETLAALDGQPLKMLGMGGRELKQQAEAYIAKASGSADVTRLAAENVSLQAQLTAMQEDIARLHAAKSAEPPASSSEFAAWESGDLKEWIKNKTGKSVRGNPSHATLVGMADQITAEESEAA